MSLHIHEEGVFEGVVEQGAGFDKGEVQGLIHQGFQGSEEGSRRVGHGEPEGCFVLLSPLGFPLADGPEPGDVVRGVLDVASDDGEPPALCGDNRADGGAFRSVSGMFCRSAGAGEGENLSSRKMSGDPAAALGEGLGMRTDRGNIFHG